MAAIVVRVDPDRLELWARVARAHGLSREGWIRRVLDEAAADEGASTRKGEEPNHGLAAPTGAAASSRERVERLVSMVEGVGVAARISDGAAGGCLRHPKYRPPSGARRCWCGNRLIERVVEEAPDVE